MNWLDSVRTYWIKGGFFVLLGLMGGNVMAGDDPITARMDHQFVNQKPSSQDVTSAVLEFIPHGSSLEDALSLLKESNFRIERVTHKVPEGERHYLAKKVYFRKMLFLTKIASIVIHSDGEKVVKVVGNVFVDAI